MKTFSRLFLVSLIGPSLILLYSCNKSNIDSNSKGTAEFSISVPDGISQTKSGSSNDTTIVSPQIMISVEDMAGNAVLTDKLVPLYIFGTGFLSTKLEIMTGEFKLTKFMVINPAGTVIYAAPVTGSPLAYLANKPLPLKFNIFPDMNTIVNPEVLVVGNQLPSQFGYATFGVQIIKPIDFYTYCILDNPLIMAPLVMTTAKVTISNNNGWIYSFNLMAAVNHLVIRGGSENYSFLVEKEGYQSQIMQFTIVNLMAATKENPLVLKIPVVSTTTKVLFLQPGPDAGKDAMISNLEPDKNFGAHKYFEATYISEPVLTVMRSNISLISFDLSPLPKSAIIKKVILKLSYDIPIPWDSTIFVTGTAVINKPCGVLQQIIEPWEENQVTWNKQPKTTEINQVLIAPFIRNVNFIDVDVTGLFVSTAANLLPNYGMLFKLNINDRFKGFRFASSDFTGEVMRPRLSVYYSDGK
jgi:hypothetical protein